MKFREMKTRELKSMVLGLYQVIYQVGSFGVKDLINYYGALRELERRGYALYEDLRIVRKKN